MYRFANLGHIETNEELLIRLTEEFERLEKHLNAPDHDLLWKTNSVSVVALLPGTNAPVQAVLRSAIEGREFAENGIGLEDEVHGTFTLGHDYAKGSKVYVRLHTASRNASPSGVARFGFEYSVAKGSGGGVLPASTTIYLLVDLTSTAQYEVMLTACADGDRIPETKLEPGSIIAFRFFRDSANAADTSTQDLFALSVELQYQAQNIGTPYRVPDFFGGD